jgi:DNA-binding transcriptional ArsR family regulator
VIDLGSVKGSSAARENENLDAIRSEVRVATAHPKRECRNRPVFRIASAEPLRAGRIRLTQHYTLWCNVLMDQLTDVLSAISHPSRRAIIGQLAAGPARFTDIARPFDTALNSVTKHIKLLERAGLIERRKQGREVLISFRGEPLREVAGWLHEYERFWNEHLDKFEQYFKDKKKKKKKR